VIERWLRGLDTIAVLDQASVSLVRERVRERCAAAGLPDDATASLATAASELAHNQLAHARGGRICVRVAEGAPAGVEVVAADEGDGIADPEGAIRGTTRSSPGAGLGIGLAGVLNLADEVDFDVRVNEGTCVWARKFVTRPRRRTVGVYGRPIEDERISGDDAGFLRTNDELLVAVADGLGHGPEARVAASLAVDTALGAGRDPLDDVLESAHERLRRTRGSVLALTRIARSGAFETAIAGNVVVQVMGRRGASRRLAGVSRALGTPGPARRARVEHDDLGAMEILALYSDGLSSHLALSLDDSHINMHPILLAQRLMTEFASTRDDALVVVVA